MFIQFGEVDLLAKFSAVETIDRQKDKSELKA